MSDVRGAGGRAQRANGRGPRSARGRPAPTPGGTTKASRAPVRLLHARHADGDRSAARGRTVARARGGTRGNRGQPVSLHRLRHHRRRGRGGEPTVTDWQSQAERRWAGKRVARLEDHGMLTGATTYVTDVRLPRMLELAFVRSHAPNARIVSIDLDLAYGVPGVHAVLRSADVADIQ